MGLPYSRGPDASKRPAQQASVLGSIQKLAFHGAYRASSSESIRISCAQKRASGSTDPNAYSLKSLKIIGFVLQNCADLDQLSLFSCVYVDYYFFTVVLRSDASPSAGVSVRSLAGGPFGSRQNPHSQSDIGLRCCENLHRPACRWR